MKRLIVVLCTLLVACTHQAAKAPDPEPPAPVVIERSTWTMTFPLGWVEDKGPNELPFVLEMHSSRGAGTCVSAVVSTVDWANGEVVAGADADFAIMTSLAVRSLLHVQDIGVSIGMLKGRPASWTRFTLLVGNRTYGVVQLAVASDGRGYVVRCGTELFTDEGVATLSAACDDVVRSFQLK